MPSILWVDGVKQPKVLQETDRRGVSEEDKEGTAVVPCGTDVVGRGKGMRDWSQL